jgi:hypothetical protein
MATYYGSLKGNRGEATRLGSRGSGIRAVLQSWDGSLSVTLFEHEGEPFVSISTGPGSTRYMDRAVYYGPLSSLVGGKVYLERAA